jgi:hypothetical protein
VCQADIVSLSSLGGNLPHKNAPSTSVCHAPGKNLVSRSTFPVLLVVITCNSSLVPIQPRTHVCDMQIRCLISRYVLAHAPETVRCHPDLPESSSPYSSSGSGSHSRTIGAKTVGTLEYMSRSARAIKGPPILVRPQLLCPNNHHGVVVTMNHRPIAIVDPRGGIDVSAIVDHRGGPNIHPKCHQTRDSERSIWTPFRGRLR